MADFEKWVELAKYIGVGGAIILGVVSYKLWNAYQTELKYSKERDRETLILLTGLKTTVGEIDESQTARDERVIKAIDALRDMIQEHLRKSERN